MMMMVYIPMNSSSGIFLPTTVAQDNHVTYDGRIETTGRGASTDHEEKSKLPESDSQGQSSFGIASYLFIDCIYSELKEYTYRRS